MQVITTTQLRTRSRELIKALEEGQSVDIIHRSKIVGEIRPKTYDPKPFDTKKLARIIESLNLPRLTSKQIDRRYRIAMMKKQGLSKITVFGGIDGSKFHKTKSHHPIFIGEK